ncbi:DUF2225 domain-containing protein [Clostridium oryzae]|uniref:Uncharacterized protein n=1 Tax=Clostridium oryzae TaxID=1450648 RepID=A0A1V4IJB4_9CLOT|nr:DUF2225 domain-containing protein [Clostridium oryzae]OPJ60102.1 hypothetical protein CLORY_29630 [Clostridium oryzae]
MDTNQNSSNSDIFSGIEKLGFNINTSSLYEEKSDQTKDETKAKNEEVDEASLLYDKEQKCPACESYFKVRSVKTNAPRLVSRDSDFFIHYSNINPYFYDVYICPNCGYASLKRDFEKLRQHQIEKIKSDITPKWKKKYYGITYDVDVAIERYKLALLNYFVIESKDSSKAMSCLKLAWMYRLKNDQQNESLFLSQALEGFNRAFFSEDFPIYGMDRYTVMYLIGELYKRTGDFDNAMKWFSKVLTTPSVSERLKDLTRDQKDYINEIEASQAKASSADTDDITANTEKENTDTKKRGFFSSLFKK